MEKSLVGFLAGGITMGIIFIFFCLITFWGDSHDLVNTRELGIRMCGQYGLEYDHREMWDATPSDPNDANIPIIYRKIDKEQKLIDDVLKVI